MILSLCLLLPALSPSSQEICSAPGDLPAPTLYLSQTSAWPGDSVRLQCSVISQLLATRMAFCQDGEEVSSQRGLLGKLTYDSDHAVSGGSSRNYSCRYEIKNSNNQVNRLQLSPPQHLITTSALPAPTLYLNQMSTQSGDSVRLQCSVFSWDLATRIIFFKDGEEVSSQRSLLGNLTDDFDHVVSGDSSGNYACAYEIKDSDNQVTRSQLSPAQHLSITDLSQALTSIAEPGNIFDGRKMALSKGLDLKLLLGITIPAVVVLAVVLYLLGKKAVISDQDPPASSAAQISNEGDSPCPTDGHNLGLSQGRVYGWNINTQEIVPTSLITLSHCIQLHLCQGIKGKESSMTPAMLMIIILNVPRWIGWETPGLARLFSFYSSCPALKAKQRVATAGWIPSLKGSTAIGSIAEVKVAWFCLVGLGEYAVAYLDDVALFSDSWAEHLEHLQKVLERIREAGLTVKAKKCQIGLNRVTYLGHQVGQGTISPLQAKVDAIQKWAVPQSKKQVQSFLGLAGYYRRFVPQYSQIAAPLTDLTKKKQPNAVQWTEKCQKAFNQLKATLMSDPVLRAPDFDKPFLVTTDVSERGVGAVLMQKGPDQEFHPVVFLSKKLSERESNWSVSEKECYAIVYALEKLRPYVWGRRFHLQTDHAALQWLHTAMGNNKKLIRWSLALQDFDFDIQHISGASNKVADALSRESFPE
ncbi:unnamed protein product [Natator depressus]